MFSPRERQYLKIVAWHQYYDRDTKEAFPNPSYRRKIEAMIRRKGSLLFSDLELYKRATKKAKHLDFRYGSRFLAAEEKRQRRASRGP
ncbi:MAG TPA: hypothetical protein VI915_00015 [Thermoplasmata archaeon]|nr:hypothetical protein [Thermoplasmata archaeon]